MTFLSRTSSMLRACRRFSVVIVAFTVMFVSKSAFATCGDYLLHRDMNALSQASDAPEGEVAPESIPEKPCHGPHCRQSPSAPLIPAQPFEWSTHSDPADLTVPTARDRSFANRRLCDADLRKRMGYPDDIERPPRAS